MKLSIIICCYNAERTIPWLLRDIFNQKVNFQYEVILIDDNSNDATKQELQKYKKYKRVSIVYNSINKGNGVSKNLGISLARWDFLLFLDDHCSISDGAFLQKYVDSYSMKEADGVCGFYETKNMETDLNYIRDLRRKLVYKKQRNKFYQISKDNRTTFSIVVGGFRKETLLNWKFPVDFGQFSSEDTVLQLILEKNNKKLYYNGEIQCFHTHNLWIADIRNKLKVEVVGTRLLYKKIKQLNLTYHYQKFYLDSIFIPIIFLLLCLFIDPIIFIITLIVFFFLRYSVPWLLSLPSIKILYFVLYNLLYDVLKLFYLLWKLDFKLIIFLLKIEINNYLITLKRKNESY